MSRPPAPLAAPLLVGAAFLLAPGPTAPRPAAGADGLSPEVSRAVERGVEYLRSESKRSSGGQLSLIGLGIAKGTSNPEDPDVARVVGAVLEKVADGYKPTHHLYEAGLDMMLLEYVDADRHRAALETILAYVLREQRNYGAWYYPNQDEGTFGDTSISQYAVLGLWSAERAGLDVPQPAWVRMLGWQLRTQQPDGGFGYHPEPNGKEKSTRTMSPAGACNLLLARLHLYGDAAVKPSEPEGDTPQAKARRKYAAFEAVDPEAEADAKPRVKDAPVPPVGGDRPGRRGGRRTHRRVAQVRRVAVGLLPHVHDRTPRRPGKPPPDRPARLVRRRGAVPAEGTGPGRLLDGGTPTNPTAPRSR